MKAVIEPAASLFDQLTRAEEIAENTRRELRKLAQEVRIMPGPRLLMELAKEINRGHQCEL